MEVMTGAGEEVEEVATGAEEEEAVVEEEEGLRPFPRPPTPWLFYKPPLTPAEPTLAPPRSPSSGCSYPTNRGQWYVKTYMFSTVSPFIKRNSLMTVMALRCLVLFVVSMIISGLEESRI